MDKTCIEVAAAVITQNGRFLLSKRLNHQHQGGKWEFPGGKIEANETIEQALFRELFEEININVSECSHFMTVEHEYEDKKVKLHFMLVTHFDGDPNGNEGQQVQWFDAKTIQTLPFPEANKPVLDKIRVLA